MNTDVNFTKDYDDTSGHGYRGLVAPAGSAEDDTEGNGTRWSPAPAITDADDTEGNGFRGIVTPAGVADGVASPAPRPSAQR